MEPQGMLVPTDSELLLRAGFLAAGKYGYDENTQIQLVPPRDLPPGFESRFMTYRATMSGDIIHEELTLELVEGWPFTFKMGYAPLTKVIIIEDPRRLHDKKEDETSE